MIILIAAISIIFLFIALARLDWAVFLIIAALPTYLVRFNILGLPLTLLETMILIAFAVWFFKFFIPGFKKLMRNKDARMNYPYSIEIILVLVISFLAIGTAEWSTGSFGIWKAYFFEPLLLYILLFNVFKTRTDWLKIIDALTLSAAAVAIFAIFQQATGFFISNPFWAASATRRVVSFFGYPNAVGLYLAPIIIIMSGRLASLNWQDGIMTHDKFKKIFMSLTILLSLLSIYFAKSEGALIGVAGGFLIFGLLAGKKSRIASLGLIILMSVGIYSYQPARHLIIEKATLSDLSGSIRKQQWKETFQMLNDSRLITGAGLDSYQKAVKPFHQEGLFYNSDNLSDFDAKLRASAEMRAKYWQPVEIYMYPHNIFLNFWSELGILGALLFVWVIAKYCFKSLALTFKLNHERNTDKYILLGLFTAMAAIVIHGLVDVPYFKNDLSALFWIIIALGSAQNLTHKQQK